MLTMQWSVYAECRLRKTCKKLTLLKVRLWLVLKYFRNENFGTGQGRIFQFLDGNPQWSWWRHWLVFFRL